MLDGSRGVLGENRVATASSKAQQRLSGLGTAVWAAALRYGAVLLAYLLLALVFTYPVLLHLGTRVGGLGDAFENYWNLWWTRHALLELGQNPLNGSYMYHPFGIPLYFHTLNLFNGVLSLPIQVCCGTAAAFNVMNLFALCMAGLGTYVLVSQLTQHRGAAFVAGLIFAFSPYTSFHLRGGQPNLVALEWLPWYLWALLNALRGSRRWTVPAAVFLLFNALVDWHHAIFAVVMTGAVAAVELASRPRQALGLFARLATVGGLFALLASPLLVPMLREGQADPYAARPLWHSTYHSTDLLAFLLPNPLHPLWGHITGPIFWERLVLPHIIGGYASIGLVALALGMYGLVRERQRAMVFAAIFVISAVLALGPYLQINGVNSSLTERPIPLPYVLFYQLPFMNIMRVPSRFVSLVMLALAVLAGIGIAALVRRPWAVRLPAGQRTALWAAAGLLVVFESLPTPVGLQPAVAEQVSPFYRQLADDDDDYAILEVPYSSPASLLNQIDHGKRTVGGRISRSKAHPWSKARIWGPLVDLAPVAADVGADESPAGWRAALASQGVRYVVFYKQGPDAERQARTQELEQAYFAGVRPVYEDAMLRAFGPLAATPELFWTIDSDGWYDVETNPDGLHYRWMRDGQGSLLVYPRQATNATLRLDALGYARQRHIEVYVDGRLADTIELPQAALTPVEVPLSLAAGENRVTLRSVEPPVTPSAQDNRGLSLMIANVSIAKH